MKYAWDQAENKTNQSKHKVSFEEATSVFDDPFAYSFVDPDSSHDEERMLIFGYSSQNKLLTAAFTLREDDIRIIRELLERLKPDQVYVAGDLADPHGTHRVCAEAIFEAIHRMKAANQPIPDVLMYRGAWQEYPLHEIEIAVPLSPSDIQQKRRAIFMHESQKDEALFPGSDPREFWQRAEDRNRGTADHYNQIGLPEFFALEAFTRWHGNPV